MKTHWMWNVLTVVALLVALVVWIVLPWWMVLAIAVLLAAWLVLTRSGRLSLAAARIGIALSLIHI